MTHITRILITDINSNSSQTIKNTNWKEISSSAGVYKILNKINGKFYIGSAKSLFKRYYTHIKCLNKNTHHNPHLQNSWTKYGAISFEFQILYLVKNYDDAIKTEQEYLNKFVGTKDCYNIAKDATAPMNGRHHSPETIEKFRKYGKEVGGKQLRKWVIENWTGQKWSEEWIEKFRQNALTRDDTKRIAAIKTPEANEKRSKAMIGRKHPGVSKRLKTQWQDPNYRQKMIEVNTRPQSEEQKKKASITKLGKSITFVSPTGEIITPISIRNFSSEYKLRRHQVQELIRGLRTEYRGWRMPD